ncbi:putative toxin-antitoxin system toxin component, PIN family [Nanoarchaeota archaeon]
MKVTTDTNVLVSGTFWRGDSARIIGLIDRGEIEIVLSEELIEEYEDVINREEIMDKVERKNLILNKSVQKIIKNSTIVEPKQKLEIVKEDPDDNMILECALEGNVDYVITNDKHLLKLKEFQGIKIVRPEEFLKLIAS